MSKVNDIKSKKVDFYVYDNVASVINSISDEEDHGKMNIVIDDSDNNDNALYIGDTHIASGYGFENISTLNEVKEFISSEAAQKLINNDFELVQNITYNVTNESNSTSTNITDSSTRVHFTEILMNNGSISSKSAIDIYTTSTIMLSNGLEVPIGATYNSYVDSDDVNISYIKLNYDISYIEATKRLPYNILVKTNSNNASIKYSGELSLEADGHEHTIFITPDNTYKTLVKENSLIENTVNYYIDFSDSELNIESIKIRLFTIIYRYKIYASTTDDESSLFTANVYIPEKENLLYINTNSSIYNYIWLPEKLTTASKYSIIFKDSNIGVSFTCDGTSTQYNNVNYRIYKSPQQYNTNTTWIVK